MELLDSDFLNPFVQATIETLKVQCKMEASLEKIAPAATIPKIPVAIAGVIGITGKSFHGAMTLSFPKKVFLALVNRMLSENHAEIIDELADGAAELSNIIFGHAKVALNSAGHEIKMALPSVMRGDELRSGAPMQMNATVILIQTEAGPLTIEFAGRKNPEDHDNPLMVPAKPGHEMPKLDGHVLMSFVRGIRQTLKVQCNVEAVAGHPFLKSPATAYQFEIGSMLGVTGASFGGTIALCFQQDVFLKIIGKMLGENLTEISKEFEDGATEIMNITFGVARQVLNEEGYALQMAIPTMIRGKSVESLYPARRPPIVLPFQALGGTFWVEFALDPDSRTGA